MLKIAPSILSADFARLGAEVADVKNGGAHYIHFDVMDGNFVPNISIGIPVLKSLRKATDMFIDVHLMIERPVRYVETFCNSGADLVNIHIEADSTENNIKALELIKSCGKKCGVTLKPATEAEAVLPYLQMLDLILVMTVEPGFGGQSFMHDQLPKIHRLRELIDHSGRSIELEVDGGIDENTARLAVDAGCDVLVAGSAIFNKADRAAAIKAIMDRR